MANSDNNNNDRRGSEGGPRHSGTYQCTVCGEDVKSLNLMMSAQNRNSKVNHQGCMQRSSINNNNNNEGSMQRSSINNNNNGSIQRSSINNNEETKAITFACISQPNLSYEKEAAYRNKAPRNDYSPNESFTDSKRSSKQFPQDNWKCVHFCDKSNSDIKPPMKNENYNKQQKCDCPDCEGPDHLCDCQLCQTEKAANKLEATRNLMHARSMFEKVPNPDEYIQRHSEKLSCDVNPFNGFGPGMTSTQTTQKITVCPTVLERPSTSAASRNFCKGNIGSVRLDTLRSIAKTELNNCIFHGATDISVESGNDDEKRGFKEKESLLIEDTYNPGIIEDCVTGVKDFNAISFGMFFEDGQEIPEALPLQTPMTLIEAFHKRISIERDHMTDALNCHELKYSLLTVEAIDLYFSYKPKTELNIALSNLFKAETLYKKEQKPLKAAKQKVDVPYDVKISKKEMPLVGGSPITLEVYTGTTIPHLKNQLPVKNQPKPKAKKTECKVELK